MKKIFFILFIFTTLSSYANESLKGTAWTYTRAETIDSRLEKYTSNFVFLTETEVIWLVETHTGQYMFPVAIGVYDNHLQTITFSGRRNGFQKSWVGNDVVVYFSPNDQIMQFHLFANTNGRIDFLLHDGVPINVQQTDIPTINNYLVDSSWSASDNGYTYSLSFISPTEVYLNNQRCWYVSMGNKVAFITGDNFGDEVLVGVWNGGTMVLYREGAYKSAPNTLMFTRN